MGRTDVFVERVELVEATLDREKRTVEVVLVRPGWSMNRRYYAPDVLAQAAPLFEGVKAYANHPSREVLLRGGARDIRDITGDYTDVRVGAEGELRATRHVYGAAGDQIWPLIERSLETGRPIVGISINAVGKVLEGEINGQRGIIVEAITQANSADDVDMPAAGGEFERLLAGGGSLAADFFEALTYEEFITARPDYVEKLRAQMKRARQDEQVRAVTVERDQVLQALAEAQTQLDEMRTMAESYRAEVDRQKLQAALERALREARLPADWETDLRQQLEKADPQDWAAILGRERKKAQTMGVRATVPVTGAPRHERPAVLESASVAPLPDENVEQWMRRTQAMRGK